MSRLQSRASSVKPPKVVNRAEPAATRRGSSTTPPAPQPSTQCQRPRRPPPVPTRLRTTARCRGRTVRGDSVAPQGAVLLVALRAAATWPSDDHRDRTPRGRRKRRPRELPDLVSERVGEIDSHHRTPFATVIDNNTSDFSGTKTNTGRAGRRSQRVADSVQRHVDAGHDNDAWQPATSPPTRAQGGQTPDPCAVDERCGGTNSGRQTNCSHACRLSSASRSPEPA